MGSSLSRIQAIIYDRDFPRFPRPAKEKEMPASEAGIKPYWRSKNRESKDRITTVNDVPVGETGHNLHAPSPQEAEV